MSKPEMGIFMIRPKEAEKCYLQATGDLRGVMNGALARLNGGMHPCRELQKEWSEQGGENFEMEILQRLPYDKDESKTDYSEELALLKMIWEEKLQKEGVSLYRKRI
jgi:hypothetical protein